MRVPRTCVPLKRIGKKWICPSGLVCASLKYTSTGKSGHQSSQFTKLSNVHLFSPPTKAFSGWSSVGASPMTTSRSSSAKTNFTRLVWRAKKPPSTPTGSPSPQFPAWRRRERASGAASVPHCVRAAASGEAVDLAANRAASRHRAGRAALAHQERQAGEPEDGDGELVVRLRHHRAGGGPGPAPRGRPPHL